MKPNDNLVRLVVARSDASKTLQDFIAAKFRLSRRVAKSVIDSRSAWVNRRCVWIARHVLKTGDLVEIPSAAVKNAARSSSMRRPNAEGAGTGGAEGFAGARPGQRQQRRHVRVIVETEHYVVADKPAGVMSNDAPHSVEAILQEQLSLPGLRAVHRLDRDTSGCLLFAKTEEACLAMVEVFKTHRVSKIYYAIVAGKFTHVHDKIDAPLDGEPAVSYVSREAAGQDASLLRVRIETGRTNQIRRHLASIRFPIVGDRTFGLKSARDPRLMAVPRQMLHAATLVLPDPMVKGGEIKAHSPLPADFRATLRLFGRGKRGR